MSDITIKIGEMKPKTLSSIFRTKTTESTTTNQFNSFRAPVSERNDHYKSTTSDLKEVPQGLFSKSATTNSREFKEPTSIVSQNAWTRPLVITDSSIEIKTRQPSLKKTLDSDSTSLDSKFPPQAETPREIREERHMIEKKWAKPPTIKSKYEKNSLAAIVENLQEKITARGLNPINKDYHLDDLKLLEKFQKNFRDVRTSWNSFMEILLEKMVEIDNKYLSYNYFNYKESLVQHLTNISMSFIVIGSDTRSGNGIDNVTGPCDSVDDDNNRPSLIKKINAFMKRLPMTMERISREHQQILKFDREHTQLLQDDSLTTNLIQTLRLSIKTQEKDIKADLNNEEKKAIQESLEQNKDSLRSASQTKIELEKKIKDTIEKKKAAQNMIQTEYYRVTSYLQFSYFVHDNWCPPLDNL
jgi:hypothetical protein